MGFTTYDMSLLDRVTLAHIEYEVAGANTILRECGNVLVSEVMTQCITDRGGLISPRCITDGSLGIEDEGLGIYEKGITAPRDVYGKPVPMTCGDVIIWTPIQTATKSIHV